MTSESELLRLTCCELTCHETADWEIWFGDSPDDNTLACTVHVGELLDPSAINRVSKAEQR